MFISEIYVKSFGKIKDKHIKLNKGLNIQVQSNGYGKSTLAAFIKAMLYGLDYKKKYGIDNDAKMYMPWDSNDKFGGWMCFEHENKTYRIERYFGLTARSESAKLIETQTGKVLDPALIAQTFVELTSDSFEQSAYIPQETVSIGANEDFVRKLSGMMDGDESQNSFEKAEKSLRNYCKSFKAERGSGGLINQLESRQEQLDSLLYRADNAEQTVAEQKRRLAQCTAEKAALSEQLAETEKQIAKLQSQPRKGTFESDEQQREYQRAKEFRLQCDYSHLESDIQSVTSQVKTKQSAIRKSFAVAGGVCAAIILVGAVLAFVLPNVFYIGAAIAEAGAVALSSCLLYSHRRISKVADTEIDGFCREIMTKYGKDCKVSYSEASSILNALLSEYRMQEETYRKLSAIAEQNDGSAEYARQLRELEEQKRTISMRIGNLDTEKGVLTERIETQIKAYDKVKIAEDAENNNAALAEARAKYDVAKQTWDLIMKAKENMSSAYLPKLGVLCRSLIQSCVEGIDDVYIDKSFNVTLSQNGVLHDVKYFSRGIRELTLFCFRIALSQMLYDGKLPFLMIDDAFVNFDDKVFANAMHLLQKLSEDTQIVYFSCHRRSVDAVKAK
ncbi:MAG: AAA family ATPase [Corallococcus sp.]|nr:AAA family ATPase [Corallococcus sp.]